MADADMGEMFLNFPMDKKDPFAVWRRCDPAEGSHPDSSCTFGSSTKSTNGEVGRTFHGGMKPSPCNSVRHFHWAADLARGNPKDPKNPFHHSKAMLNSPGLETFDPTRIPVFKWNGLAQRVAADAITFTDDMRGIGFSKENTWQVTRRLASILQCLGI
jgi:hypothetical protein